MNDVIATLVDNIKTDYYEYTLRGRDVSELSEINKTMIAEFNDSITVKEGRKYIKITQNNSVWGFIVNVEDDKQFQNGDILKAAGYNMPARNKARGNVIEGGYTIRWTGPLYL